MLGDLTESSEDVRLVETATRWARAHYIDDPAHPGTAVTRYHELDDGRRLDCAVRDDDRTMRVAIEAERINNDVAEATPADFDKLAACDLAESVRVVNSRADAYDVLDALIDPGGMTLFSLNSWMVVPV